MLNLKHFLAGLPSNSRVHSSGLVGRPKSSVTDLLIMRGLPANLPRKKRERLLNLKDLPTPFLPGLKGLFEDEPRLEASFLCTIAPNSAIFCQNVAEYGIKSGFFATDFVVSAIFLWQH